MIKPSIHCVCLTAAILLSVVMPGTARAGGILIEAEGFEDHGGWQLDTQFIEIMGSPYLLAHGLGEPVADATTSIRLDQGGRYRVYARTKDWVAPWGAPGAPGRFRIAINGRTLPTTFGTQGEAWHWQKGDEIELDAGTVTIALRDLTGFDGRCDAVYLAPVMGSAPPDGGVELQDWRNRMLGLADDPIDAGPYDLVVVGGGYSGIGAAVSAARMGCRVALIQNRPVLGGNGSSEVRVSAEGGTRLPPFEHLGEIVESFADDTHNVAAAVTFGDDVKQGIVTAEANIDLFLNCHVFDVEAADGRIRAVVGLNTRTSERRRFTGAFFVDATGHGTVGYEAGADYDMTMTGHMGMSNLWAWRKFDGPRSFPATPWALPLELNDFPYPSGGRGEWYWESGFDKHPIDDLESMRDWNLRAVYGAWQAIKSGPRAADHANAALVWVAYIGGPRESRRLLGDVVLTERDILHPTRFPDGCVPTTWTIDLHYPRKQYAAKFPDDPFISYAEHKARTLRDEPYLVPYRCFYSRNIENLFMAGRDVSVTHEALGTVRVMKTCGMMGEVVGKAAAICVRHGCEPREVYHRHLEELIELLGLAGETRRDWAHGRAE
jgi:hypothetical protein